MLSIRRTMLGFALAALAVTGVSVDAVSANGQILPIAYIGDTTGSCPSGRVCVNIKTVNSCGSVSGNKCSYFNAPGDAQDLAYANNTSVWSNIYSLGQRLFNNNTGTQRPFCGYSSTDLLGTQSYAPYGGGWTPAPFTGVKSIAVVVVNGLC